MTGTLSPWDLTTCFQILGIFLNQDFWPTGRFSPCKIPKYRHITSANTSVCMKRMYKVMDRSTESSLCIFVENLNFLKTKDWNEETIFVGSLSIVLGYDPDEEA